MSVRYSDVDHLLEVLRPTLERFLASSKQSAGDFAKVEAAGAPALSAMRQAMMSAGLTQSAEATPQQYACPTCNKRLSRQSVRDRTVVTALGEATYTGVRWRCGECHQDYYPLEEANGLHASQYTTKAQGLIGTLSSEVPYAQASRLLALLGVPVSPKQTDRTAQDVSRWCKAEEVGAIARTFAQSETLRVEQPPARYDWSGWKDEDVVVISVDGGKVRSPERGEDGLLWFECRIGVIAPANENSRARKIYVGGIMNADALFDLVATAWRSRPGRRMKVLFISDGADWIWRRVQLYFGGAIEVLDVYHASEHVASAAAAYWGPESKEAKEWQTHARDMLLVEDGPKRVRRKLLRMLLSGKAHDPSELRKEIRYLFRHRRRMPYQTHVQQGLPVGSGVMESAVKQVNTARLRRAGMKWTREGADNMLRLRSSNLSGALEGTVDRRHESLLQLAQRYTINQQIAA